ncbi:mutarotase [Nibribacter ruber]|uniref:Mutarotase n=1 Tax=Nibribacter ruber TaxID=2698458 RepID=A0A6P1NY91_9BACT|nr:2'-5' RNA ligase family protein [Nibribacter ruber]QHL88000.1 mutarotase [Nibribacter ruber]
MPQPLSLSEQYDSLWQHARQEFARGHFEIDPFLADTVPDTRRGITLLTRPNAEVQAQILQLLQSLKAVEPMQYFYPASDLHITLLSIISCSPNFKLGSIPQEDYIQVIREALQDIGPFTVHFKGITASPSCIMVQGFPDGEGLQQLREKLRTAFKNLGLHHTIDQRYTIQTAHSTVLRFQAPLQHPDAFLEQLENFRTIGFGIFTVDQVELVYNDWYQRASNTQALATFRL